MSRASAPIKVGVLGYGNSAHTFHLPFINLSPDLQVVAFLQRDSAPKDGKRHCSLDYPAAAHYTTIDDFVTDTAVELVVVTTWHDTHGPYTLRCLAMPNVKAVVCEKPLCPTTAEAAQVVAAAKASGKLVIPFQNRRYDTDFLTLRKLMDLGALGELTDLELHMDMHLPAHVTGDTQPAWAPGRGTLVNVGIHSIDQAVALFGAPQTVWGQFRALRPGVPPAAGEGGEFSEDDYRVVLRYADSPRSVLVTGSSISLMDRSLKLFARGTKGSYMTFGMDPQEDQLHGGMKPSNPAYGTEAANVGTLWTQDKVDEGQVLKDGVWVGQIKQVPGDFGGYWRAVVDAVRGGSTPVNMDDAVTDLRIIDLARQSSKEGRVLRF